MTSAFLYGHPPFVRYFQHCSDEESRSSTSGLVRGNAIGPDEIPLTHASFVVRAVNPKR